MNYKFVSKIFFIFAFCLIICFKQNNFVFASLNEIKEYNININKTYIILFDENVSAYKNLTPKILKLEKIATLNNDKNQFILYGKELGSGKLSFEFDNDKKFEYTIHISEYNNLKNEDDVLFEIDKPSILIPQEGLNDMELDSIWMKY